MQNEDIICMKNICKEFPGVKALSNVNFNAKGGEVHVLLGENGAGKSTIMKILTGVHKPTSGEIIYMGEHLKLKGIKDAQERGISIIFQELNVLRNMTVAENIFLGREKGNVKIRWKEMYNEADKILRELGVSISSKTLVKELTVGQMQMVEIAKALSFNARVLIMDEPTSALTEKEIQELFQIIRKLKAEGVAIIYISHRLDEIKQIGDKVTILRDGNYVDTVDLKELEDLNDLIKMMVGRTLEEKFPTIEIEPDEVGLEVIDLSQGDRLKNISFYARRGEIVGFYGLMGSGRTELMRAIFGADKYDNGEIKVFGETANIKNCTDAIRHRIAFLTEDRKNLGLVLEHAVRENITLSNLSSIINKSKISLKKEQKLCVEYIDKLNIKTPSCEQKIKFLSGGNQQKVVVAKWLNTDSEIVIFDEPTRGIDVGAKIEIYNIMNQLKKQGKVILLISSELPEAMEMSDRLYVMHEGRITAEITNHDVKEDDVLHKAMGL